MAALHCSSKEDPAALTDGVGVAAAPAEAIVSAHFSMKPTELLTNWKYFPYLAALLVLGEAVLSLVIIRFIKCTRCSVAERGVFGVSKWEVVDCGILVGRHRDRLDRVHARSWWLPRR